MPIILQEKLIQWILRPVSRMAEKIPRAVRDSAVSLSVAGFIFVLFGVNSRLLSDRFLLRFVVGCLLFAVMIFCGLTPDLKPVRFSRALTACWLPAALFMLLTGVLVDADRLSNATLFLVVLPVFYLVWSGPGFDRLFPLVIRGVMLSLLFFAVVSVFFYPLTSIDYASFFFNRNLTGLYLAGVFVCLLCFIFAQDRYSLRVFTADAATGFTAATLYYTNCRAAILASALCFLSAGVLQILTNRKNWRRVLLHQLLPIAAAVVLLVPNTAYLYRSGYFLSSAVQKVFEEPAEEEPSAPGTPSVSEMMTAMEEYYAKRNTTKSEIPNGEALSPLGKALDSLTSGRVTLWIIHMREIGLLGNSTDKVLYDLSGEVEHRSSHFTAIQFAYDYGVLAGVFFLLLNILAGLSSIRFAFSRRDIKYRLAPFAIAVAFGAESVMEALGIAVADILSLLYFLSLAPLVAAPLSGAVKADADGGTEGPKRSPRVPKHVS